MFILNILCSVHHDKTSPFNSVSQGSIQVGCMYSMDMC